jgi:hypothetical protein
LRGRVWETLAIPYWTSPTPHDPYAPWLYESEFVFATLLKGGIGIAGISRDHEIFPFNKRFLAKGFFLK